MRIQHRRPLIAGLCLFFACVLAGTPARAASMRPATPLAGKAVPPGAAPARERPQAALLGIPDLRARSYGGGAIRIGAIYARGQSYTTYRISYPSDGLRLTGLLHVP